MTRIILILLVIGMYIAIGYALYQYPYETRLIIDAIDELYL